MKREIIFRGIHANRWVFGSLLTYTDKYHAIVTFDDKSIETIYPVNSKTVGQFTGLTDKNGVKIFEGDKLSNDKNEIGFIIFYEGKFCLQAKRRNNSIWYMPLDVGFVKNKEVIGNIHNNPKLL